MSREDTSMAEGTSTVEERLDTAVAEGDIIDITEELNVEDFDFDAFVDGVRPGRRAVKITMRADLMLELDRIIAEYEATDKEDRDEEELLTRFNAVKAEVIASQRLFVVEARSDARIDEIKEEMRTLGKPEPNRKATEEMRREWREELLLRRLADAIITPSNVTYEGLAKLREVAESQINLLVGTMQMVNSNPTDGVKGVTPDFSRGR